MYGLLTNCELGTWCMGTKHLKQVKKVHERPSVHYLSPYITYLPTVGEKPLNVGQDYYFLDAY